MDATSAMHASTAEIRRLISNLTPEDREKQTPCAKWTVHDLIGHVCGGGHMIALGLQGQAPPEDGGDLLAEGPSAGFETMTAHLSGAATPEALAALHQMPFGEVPGEMALSVIIADHVTHAWDLAQATGQECAVGDDLAGWALGVWQGVVPPEGRDGDNFAEVVEVGGDASALDRLVAYTGRQP